MIESKDILADLHVHTVNSMHAYSTITECIDAAREKGLEYLGITDHFYGEERIREENELVAMRYMRNEIQKYYNDITLVNGGEFNVAVDLSDMRDSAKERLSEINWKLLGIHSWFYKPSKHDYRTTIEHFIETAEQLKPSAFAHIEREMSCYSIHEIKEIICLIVGYAIKNDIILEINESSLSREPDSPTAPVEIMKLWVPYALEHNAYFSLGSDSHYHKAIGNFDKCLEFVNSVGVPRNKIINCDRAALKALIKY